MIGAPIAKQCQSLLEKARPIRRYGRVTRVVGLAVEAICPDVPLGATCRIERDGAVAVPAEVVGFREQRALLMPYGDTLGIAMGDRVRIDHDKAVVGVGPGLLGRIVDGMGNPVDDRGPLSVTETVSIYGAAPNPLQRKRISEPLDVGVRVINTMLTCGRGQRVGIFSGSGVGKSTLLGMMARYTAADVNVIALVGERGRELREFIERDLGPEGLRRSVVVVATSDQPPLIRSRAAYVATSIAEHFRRRGKHVLFMMDSLTRWAMAQREIGLAVGEPPTARGYTPSVFARLPQLLERAGTSSEDGSVTGIYTVLVEGDDLTEPITDAARSILDGHIVLSREIASRGQFPSVDLSQSVSRVMDDVTQPQHRERARRLRQLVALHAEAEDLINLGAYAPGRNTALDEAVDRIGKIRAFLSQSRDQRSTLKESIDGLAKAVA